MVSWTWRLATPLSDPDLTVATVPRCRGTYSSSTVNFTSASPFGPSLISSTVPEGIPPTMTWLPGTSCEAFSKVPVTKY